MPSSLPAEPLLEHNERMRAIRLIKYLLFSASIIPALVAGSMSIHQPGFSWLWFSLCVIVLLIGQAGADYLYYYFTHYHTEARDAHTKIFSGWRPLFTGVWIKPEQTLAAGIACLVIDLLIGVYFYTRLGPVVIWLALAGGFVAIFFTPLMLRGWKEPLIFLTFGPLCTVSVYFILTGRVDLQTALVSIPVGLLVALVAYYKGARYEVRQEKEEAFVTNMRRSTAGWLLGLAYFSLAASAMAGLVEFWAALGLLTIPLAGTLYRRTTAKSRVLDYLKTTVYALGVLILTGFLICAGFLLGPVLG